MMIDKRKKVDGYWSFSKMLPEKIYNGNEAVCLVLRGSNKVTLKTLHRVAMQHGVADSLMKFDEFHIQDSGYDNHTNEREFAMLNDWIAEKYLWRFKTSFPHGWDRNKVYLAK